MNTNISTLFDTTCRDVHDVLNKETLRELDGVAIHDVCGRSVPIESLTRSDRLIYTVDSQKRIVSVLAIRGDLV
jgi:hypothetical protein